MDRVKEFLGERLRGRAVPEDLRRLVDMQLDGELARAEIMFRDVRVLGPGEVHPLEEPARPGPGDEYAAEARANGAAISGVLAHVAVVVNGIDGNLWGYWVHPDEPADRSPLVLKLTTEPHGELALRPRAASRHVRKVRNPQHGSLHGGLGLAGSPSDRRHRATPQRLRQ